MTDMAPDLDSTPLERLVTQPSAYFFAACERAGRLPDNDARSLWLAATGDALKAVKHGHYWWQSLLVNMTEDPDPAWAEAARRLSQGSRPAAMTREERDAGAVRYSAEAVRLIRQRLQAETEAQARRAAGYAWMLWRASVATGLRIVNLRRAVVTESGILAEQGGQILLRRLSSLARVECQRLARLRKQVCGAAGEEAVYAGAVQAWERAARAVPAAERPSLSTARHLSLAVWRRELSNPLLAVLLQENEEDVAPWGLELDPLSELDLHRPPPPPHGAKRAAAGGFTVAELGLVTALAVLLTGIGLALAGGRVQLARQDMALQNITEAARTAATVPGRNRYTFNTAAAEILISFAGVDATRTRASAGATDVGDLQTGAYLGSTATANRANLGNSGGNTVNIPNCAAQSIQVILYPSGMQSGNPLRSASAGWLLGRLENAGFTGVVSLGGVFSCMGEN